MNRHLSVDGGDLVIDVDFPASHLMIVCGHYGSGKTNVAVNLALELKARDPQRGMCFVDMDVVNPYFRGADSKQLLTSAGVDVIAPQFANTNVDIPSLPPEIYSIFSRLDHGAYVVIDVGGDAEGSAALGFLGDRIKSFGYEMLFVANKYRPLTATPEEAVEIMRQIESACSLKCTQIVNNSNLGAETTKNDVLSSLDYADRLCELTSLPAAFTSTTLEMNEVPNAFRIKNVTKKIFG